MIKSNSFEKNIAVLLSEKNSLENRLSKIMQIARENEIELEKYKTTLREKEFELEEVTNFYHKTLEDLAITCSELDAIKDTSIENMQRLKDQISELNLELAVARRKSRGLSQYTALRQSTPLPFSLNGKNAIGIVDSLINDLTKKLKSMPMV